LFYRKTNEEETATAELNPLDFAFTVEFRDTSFGSLSDNVMTAELTYGYKVYAKG